MIEKDKITKTALNRLRRPLVLTRIGMVAERITIAFWPFLSVLLLAMAALMFGLHDVLPLEFVWGGAVLFAVAALFGLIFGSMRFRWPSNSQAQSRLDASLSGRPISAILDDQIIGTGDANSEAVWQAHVERMAKRAENARAVLPDLRVSKRDPFALRYVATLAMVMALLFGSVLRVASVSELGNGANGALLAGPAWEGWVEPPGYTGKPSIYLPDVSRADLTVPLGSRLTLRLYGEIGSLTVAETISGRTGDIGSAAEASQSFFINQTGTLAIEGEGGQSWEIKVTPDTAPTIGLAGEVERRASGELHIPFVAQDDYGIETGYAELELDIDAVDRRFGLAVEPEKRPLITFDLPMPFNGDRREIAETLVEDLAQHPWSGLPVRVSFFAIDAAEQSGASVPETILLPGRRFFDPLAAALVEQRRDLLWNRVNAANVAMVLRAVSYRPDDIFDSSSAYLQLRVAIRRVEAVLPLGDLTTELQEETAQVLWDIAVLLEDGNLADARERLERAQDRLEQAMRDGASDDEIAELMEEMREAMQDYMQQLAEQQSNENTETAENENAQEISPQQLQDLLDELQELMEQGRMAEAQELMEQLREMMENMQVTQGEGQTGPGQQALNDLSDTLQEQQGLNDDTFGDLQDQFGQEGEDGQQGEQGELGQENQDGEQGQGGQQGQQGQTGRGGEQGQGEESGEGQGRGGGSDPAQGLAQRQQALRDQLDRQSQNLPGAGTESGQAARDALDRAGRAMDGAEQDLRENDFAGALDNQSEALEALREGMRELADQLAQQQNQQSGQQGEAFGRAQNETRRDPLGRDASGSGTVGTDENLLQGEDVYRRAQELLREIRRRSSEQERPEIELEYLKRLLDQF